MNEPQNGTLDRLATATATTLGVPLVAITILDGSQQLCVGAHGFRRDDRTLAGSFCLEVAIANRPVVVQDARSRHAPATRTAWGADLVAYAGVPLSPLDSARHGAIGACVPTRRAWQDRDLAILRAFGEAASVVLELELRLARATVAYASLEARTSDLALDMAVRESSTDHERRRITVEVERSLFHDELTGLFNRRGLFAAGTARLEELRRAGEAGVVLYVDVDGLTSTNDHLGDAIGDEILRATADVLRQIFSTSDTIARVGGDEFVVVASTSEPRAILERITTELAIYNARRDPSMRLAWCIGTVEIDPSSAAVLEHLVSEADRRMRASRLRLHG